MSKLHHIEIKSELPKLKKIRKKIEDLEEIYDEMISSLSISNAEFKITENSTILCKKCNKRSRVKNVEYLVWYWYETPHGCTGGDEYHKGGYNVECPKCGFVSKITKASVYASKEDKYEYKTFERLIKFGIKSEDVYERV